MEYRQGSVIFYFESFFQTYAKFCVAQWISSYPQAADDLEPFLLSFRSYHTSRDKIRRLLNIIKKITSNLKLLNSTAGAESAATVCGSDSAPSVESAPTAVKFMIANYLIFRISENLRS